MNEQQISTQALQALANHIKRYAINSLFSRKSQLSEDKRKAAVESLNNIYFPATGSVANYYRDLLRKKKGMAETDDALPGNINKAQSLASWLDINSDHEKYIAIYAVLFVKKFNAWRFLKQFGLAWRNIFKILFR